MKRYKRYIALVTICAVFVFGSMAAASTSEFTHVSPKNVEGQITEYITKVVTSAYSYYYNVSNVKANIYNLMIDGDKYEADIMVSFNNVLKATKPEELPFIQGMI